MSEEISNKKDLPDRHSKLNERINSLKKRVKNNNQRIRSGEKLVCYLLIDCSTSMAGNKLSQAKSGSISFTENAFSKGYSVGIITFSSHVTEVSKPTSNITNLKSSINKLVSDGSTKLNSALLSVKSKVSKNHKKFFVVLVTDGMPDNVKSSLKTANQLKSLGVEIIAIGTDDADQDFLKKIATSDELAVPVEQRELGSTIEDSSKYLPKS
jgi:Mg-chelatase subunit ChlD